MCFATACAPTAALSRAALANAAAAAVRTDTAAVFPNATVAEAGHIHAELLRDWGQLGLDGIRGNAFR